MRVCQLITREFSTSPENTYFLPMWIQIIASIQFRFWMFPKTSISMTTHTHAHRINNKQKNTILRSLWKWTKAQIAKHKFIYFSKSGSALNLITHLSPVAFGSYMINIICRKINWTFSPHSSKYKWIFTCSVVNEIRHTNEKFHISNKKASLVRLKMQNVTILWIKNEDTVQINAME